MISSSLVGILSYNNYNSSKRKIDEEDKKEVTRYKIAWDSIAKVNDALADSIREVYENQRKLGGSPIYSTGIKGELTHSDFYSLFEGLTVYGECTFDQNENIGNRYVFFLFMEDQKYEIQLRKLFDGTYYGFGDLGILTLTIFQ